MSRRTPTKRIVHAPHLLPKPKTERAPDRPVDRRKTSAVTKLLRAKRALISWGQSGFALASRDERKHRYSLCQACPYWNKSGNFWLGECQHKDCGCTKAKTALANQSCPIGKWGPVEPSS